eukprot:744067-Pelagomonas_calceolata.AAC.4
MQQKLNISDTAQATHTALVVTLVSTGHSELLTTGGALLVPCPALLPTKKGRDAHSKAGVSASLICKQLTVSHACSHNGRSALELFNSKLKYFETPASPLLFRTFYVGTTKQGCMNPWIPFS